MTKDEKLEIIDNKLDQLRKLLDLVDVAEDIQEQFPDDPDISEQVQESFIKRLLGIHMAFVDILLLYDEDIDLKLVDLMTRNFVAKANDDTDKIDKEIEEYFGEINNKRKKIVVHKRREVE